MLSDAGPKKRKFKFTINICRWWKKSSSIGQIRKIDETFILAPVVIKKSSDWKGEGWLSINIYNIIQLHQKIWWFFFLISQNSTNICSKLPGFFYLIVFLSISLFSSCLHHILHRDFEQCLSIELIFLLKPTTPN